MEASIEVEVPFQDDPEKEQIIACMASLGYEAFEENNHSVSAFCAESAWQGEESLRTAETWLGLIPHSLKIKIHAPENYNAAWEAALKPVFVDDFVQILPVGTEALPGFSLTLRIQPQMSFGTGHHQTTRLMMRLMEKQNFTDRNILDMGSGTGILGILAARLHAAQVTGIDIEDWCTENAGENAALNQTEAVCSWITGDVNSIPENAVYDLILANINRNILIRDGAEYIRHLKPGGNLLISGFFAEDAPALKDFFTNAGMIFTESLQEDQWMALSFSGSLPK